ncbi:unnamed protein product [Mycena citricolor]|uniref:Uncharacterized protein n=1 Tax=Mycena citricolor TaxID=2018698 RepID=A0AAD2HMH2_9AGAR|nr:unnamed protein product [Mycena citricolor]
METFSQMTGRQDRSHPEGLYIRLAPTNYQYCMHWAL